MTLSLGIENLVSDLDVSIGSFFTTQELDQLAREAGFVQRKSKLNDVSST